MSWSVQAVGKSDSVAKKLHEQFATMTMAGPEQDVVNAVAALVEVALGAQIPATAVKVTAFGSQSSMGQRDAPTRYTNSLKIEIEPLHGFID